MANETQEDEIEKVPPSNDTPQNDIGSDPGSTDFNRQLERARESTSSTGTNENTLGGGTATLPKLESMQKKPGEDFRPADLLKDKSGDRPAPGSALDRIGKMAQDPDMGKQLKGLIGTVESLPKANGSLSSEQAAKNPDERIARAVGSYLTAGSEDARKASVQSLEKEGPKAEAALGTLKGFDASMRLIEAGSLLSKNPSDSQGLDKRQAAIKDLAGLETTDKSGNTARFIDEQIKQGTLSRAELDSARENASKPQGEPEIVRTASGNPSQAPEIVRTALGDAKPQPKHESSVTQNQDGTLLSVTARTDGSKVVEARDANGKNSYKVEFDKDGKPCSVQERGGYEWKSSDGGKTWVAHQDGKAVEGKAPWKGSVSVDEKGNLVSENDAAKYTRQPDGSKITQEAKDANGDQKTLTQKPDGTSLSVTSRADGSKEVTAKDANGKESYTVKFDKDGNPSSVKERGGYEWKSSDGGKTWAAHQDGKAVEGHSQWKGSISVDDKGNLVSENQGVKYTRQPDGSKITQEARDANGDQKTLTQKPDGTSLGVTSRADGSKEVTAKDSSGKESYTVKFDKAGNPSSVQERGGYEWKSEDGGKTWVAHQDGKAVEGKPPWKGSISVDEKGNLVSENDGIKYTRQPDGGKISQEARDANGDQKTLTQNPDGSTVSVTERRDGTKEVQAKDASGKESYTVKYDKDGKPNSIKERDGYEWKSTDGGKTWVAQENGKPVEGVAPWKGSISIDDKGNLVQNSEGGTTVTRQPDGTRVTEYPKDKDTGNRHTEIERPDGSKLVKLADGNSFEIKDNVLTAYDKNGKVIQEIKDLNKAIFDHLASLTNAVSSSVNVSNTVGFFVTQAIPEIILRGVTAPAAWVDGKMFLPGSGISQHPTSWQNMPDRARVMNPNPSPKDWENAFKAVRDQPDQFGKRWGNCAEQAACLAHLIMQQIKNDPAMAGCQVRQVHSTVPRGEPLKSVLGPDNNHSWIEVKHPNGQITLHDPWGQQSGSRQKLDDLKEHYNNPNRQAGRWHGR